jgi:hypothetical protein
LRLNITPETTVGALLEAYPEAESVLIGMAPAFAKLRNPMVRRTVARVATLEQAARIGGVSLHAMIRELRAATGGGISDLPVLPAREEAAADAAWLMEARVVKEVNAEALLEHGVHPFGEIREAVAALGPEEVVVLRSLFRPQPLIDAMRRAGAAVHSTVEGTTHRTYFGIPRA